MKNVHCFLSLEKGEELQSRRKFASLVCPEKEGRLLLLYSREVPGGVAHCWRDDDDDCLGCCPLFCYRMYL